MTTYNVRIDNQSISRIIYGEDKNDYISGSSVEGLITINDSDNSDINVAIRDIDYLIKALKKAKAEWGE